LHSLDYLGLGGGVSADGGHAADSAGGAGASGGGGGSAATNAGAGSGALNTAGLTGDAGTAGTDTDVPRCDDLLKTGDETDLDCGGRTCEPCAAGKTCALGTDCQSAICTNVVCQPPSCSDLALNGDETDLNCGGSCPACAQGRSCAVDEDCSTSNCSAGLCESTTCADGVLRAGCPLLVDNTPYSLSPATASSNCIDDHQDSVSEGNAVRLHACKSELRQTFWAVERADGYFAFRSALSGKCLHVRGASTTGGALIEQSTCSFAYDQLWKPSRIDSSLMALTSHFSGLSLNVAGDDATKDGQAIIQGQVDDSPDTQWQILRRTTAAYVAFSADAEQTLRIQHEARVATLGAEDRANAHWIVVPGLSNASLVSFQSRNDPGRYLRHASYRLWSDTNDGSSIFAEDATFRYAPPFVGTAPLAKALESSNYPGSYLKREGAIISLAPASETPDYKASATWRLVGR
jgi:alpha-L-arabinofuranosidase B-like protein/ricin-type beta-trefoil lectin protein